MWPGHSEHQFLKIKVYNFKPYSKLHFKHEDELFYFEIKVAGQEQTSIPIKPIDIVDWNYNFDFLIKSHINDKHLLVQFHLLFEDPDLVGKYSVVGEASIHIDPNINGEYSIFIHVPNNSAFVVGSLQFSTLFLPPLPPTPKEIRQEADSMANLLPSESESIFWNSKTKSKQDASSQDLFSSEDFTENKILTDQEKLEVFKTISQDSLQRASIASEITNEKAIKEAQQEPAPNSTIDHHPLMKGKQPELEPNHYEPGRSIGPTSSAPTGSGRSSPLSNVIGLVSLQVVAAQGLPRERKLLRLNYEINPFVIICFGKQTFRTKIVKRTTNPIWKEHLYFTIKENEAGYLVIFSIYDYDRFGYNNCIGVTNVSASFLLSSPNQIQKLALSLSTGSKDVEACLLVKACFVPYETLRKNFWRTLAHHYDYDEDGKLNKIELTAMLESIGSTLEDSTIEAVTKKIDIDNDECSYSINQLAETLEEMTISTSQINSSAENIIRLEECPVCGCHLANQQMDVDVVTHLAICITKDASQLDRVVMGGFLTEEYASRKWFMRVFSFMSFGGYRLGKNNGNIFVQDRLTGKLLEEKIPTYIRLGIRFLVQSPGSDWAMARQLFQTLTIKQGRKFNDPSSVKNIPEFVSYHCINMDEVLEPIDKFSTFNEFFYRKLKPNARTLASLDSRIVVAPADCRILCFPSINEATRLWIKGNSFTIGRLLRDERLGSYFGNGAVAICRLAPQDYHRFHSPVDGDLSIYYHIPGTYYTVNPMAIRQRLDVFTDNVRTVFLINSDHFGKVAVVAIGAMMVGSIVVTVGESNTTTDSLSSSLDGQPREKTGIEYNQPPYALDEMHKNTTIKERHSRENSTDSVILRSGGHRIQRMDELGYFAFGGSTIVILFAPGKIEFDPDLVINSQEPLETLVQLGNSIGTLV